MASKRFSTAKAANTDKTDPTPSFSALNDRHEALPVRVQPTRAQCPKPRLQPRAAEPSAPQKHREEHHKQTEKGNPGDAPVPTHEHELVAPPQSENNPPVSEGEGAATLPTTPTTTTTVTDNLTRESSVPQPQQPTPAPPVPHVPGDAIIPTEEEVRSKLVILQPDQYDLTSNNEAFADWLRAFKDERQWAKIEAALIAARCVPQVIACLRADVHKWANSSDYDRFLIKCSWMRVFYVFDTFTADHPTTLDDVFDPTWFSPFANDEGWTSTWRIAKLARSFRILSPEMRCTRSALQHAWARAQNHNHNPTMVEKVTRRGTALLKAVKDAYGRGSLRSTSLPPPSPDPPLGTGSTYWMAFLPYGTHLPRVAKLLYLDFDCDKKPRPHDTFDVQKGALETLQVLEFGPDILDCPPSDDKLTPDILAAHIVWLRLDAALKLRGGRDPELQLEQRKIRDFILEGGLTAGDPTTDLRWKIILVHLKKSHKMACDVLNASSSPAAVSPPHPFPANELALRPEPKTTPMVVANDTVPYGELPAIAAHASPVHANAANLPSRLETLMQACARDWQAVGSNTPQAVELLDRVSNFVVDLVDIVGTATGFGHIPVRNHLDRHLQVQDVQLTPSAVQPHSLPHRLSGEDLDTAIAQRHDRAAAPTPVQHKAPVLVRSAVVKDDAPVPSTASDTVVVSAAKGGASSKQRKDAKQPKATETKPAKDAKVKTKPKTKTKTAAREVIENSEPENDDDINLVTSATPDLPAVQPPTLPLPQAAAPLPTRTAPLPRASLANNHDQYAWLKQALTVPPPQPAQLQKQDDDKIPPRQHHRKLLQDFNQVADRPSNKRPAVEAAQDAPPAKKLTRSKDKHPLASELLLPRV